MIDTHCHLDSERFDADRAEVLERAFTGGITGILVPAIGPFDWDIVAGYASQDARLQCGLGIHPQYLPELREEDDDKHLEQLDALLGEKKAVAVGECGLDGPTLPNAPLERQIRVLKRHFELAQKHQLPVLLHCYRLHPAFRDFLKEVSPPEAGVLMHSFSGGVDLAKVYARAGFYISFAGPVSYPEARKPLDALKAVPLKQLLVETDAPDQAPFPHRGQRSEPSYTRLIVDAMAQALGMEPAELAAVTEQNTRRLFPSAFPE